MLSFLYGSLARFRRRWYARHPEARRTLAQPVVSIGNLTVGGSGKTPLVAHLAQILVAAGERPAILSRGYGRTAPADGVIVVRDFAEVRAELPSAGDEPLMLARSLAGVAVLVSPNRHLAGVLAERRLGCSMHLLDDGFQHLELERDLDLLVMGARDLAGARVLPAGRLREPLDVARIAHAIVVVGASEAEASDVAARLHVPRAFRATRGLGQPRPIDPDGTPATVTADTPVLALAGIARPERFFDDLRSHGATLVGELRFRDHHAFSRRDLEDIQARMRALGAEVAITTEKDAIRLEPLRPLSMPLAWVPLQIEVEPAQEFRKWLLERLAGARASKARRASG